MRHELHNIFNPRSIGVIGASEVPGKAAERRTRSLLEGGYQGKVFLINPKRDTLFNRKAYPSIVDIEDQVDLVMIVIPSKIIPQAVADSVKMGAKGIVIITAGLGETGDEGKKIEMEILKIAEQGGARVIGPNCSGMFSAAAQMNLLGVPPIEQGPISVIAQSGNIIDSLTHYGQLKKVGFSKIISAGNAIGIKFHEYVEYLNEDKDTKVILLYMEGIKEGGELVKVARKVSQNKPIIALKVGRSTAGARAASSHTGSLAGDDTIVEAAFKQAGIIRVSNVDEMFDLGMAFAYLPMPKGKRVAIVSEGGGDNSVAADNAEVCGMEVPVLPEETQAKIRPFLLEGMPASNPIDYGGTAEENPDMVTKVCQVLMEDQHVDGIYVTGFFGGFKDIIAPHVAALEDKAADDISNLVKTYKKPIVFHTSFAHEPIKSLDILKHNGIPVLSSSARAARCLAALMDFSVKKEQIKRAAPLASTQSPPKRAREIIKKVQGANRKNLLETEVRELFETYGITLPTALLASDKDYAIRSWKKLGCPVAMKVVSPEVIHKSDVGGVLLGLREEEEVVRGFDTIVKNVKKADPSAQIIGVLLSPMASQGVECIIGMTRDPNFGPVLMFGLGGIFVEVLKDVSFRVVPPTEKDIDEMMQGVKGYSLLTGIRGKGPKDVAIVKDILVRLSRMIIENPELAEVDLNPVIVHEKGASIVDLRALIE